MRTTIDLPNDLYRRVKLRAAMRGGSIRGFVIECLQRGLEEDEPQPPPDAAAQPGSAPPVPGSRMQLDEDGWPVLLRPADDRTVVTQQLIDQIRDQGNA